MASNGISCTDFFADSNFLTLYDSVKNVLKKENNAYIAVMTTLGKQTGNSWITKHFINSSMTTKF